MNMYDNEAFIAKANSFELQRAVSETGGLGKIRSISLRPDFCRARLEAGLYPRSIRSAVKDQMLWDRL